MSDVGNNISNYDVLVDAPIPGMSTEFSLAKHKDHVGNNRLQVFLTLYQQSYQTAFQQGNQDECNKLVDKVVDTVCNQCVPRGRFLASQSVVVGNSMPMIQWNQMEAAMIKSLLHRVLKPVESASSTVIGGMAAVGKPEMQTLPSEKTTTSETSETKKEPSIFPPPPIPKGLDDGQKRRRRSSLLRRSASESMVGLVLDNKKKLNLNGSDYSLFGGTQEEPASWKSARSAGQGLTSLNRMDVVLTSSRNALDPNSQSVGNNRLHILVAMQSSKYQQGSIEEREAVLDEVIQTVYMFWKGRFMVDGPNGYEQLDKDEARHAIRSILDMRTGNSTIPPLARFKRHSDPLGGMAGFQSGVMMGINAGGGITGGGEPLGRHSTGSGVRIKSSQLNMKPPPARPNLNSHKQASTSILPSGTGVDLPDVSHLRSMAVKSLQKQKQRQNIANRLQKMGVTDEESSGGKESVQRFPVFPLGGKVQPSSFARSSAFANNSRKSTTGFQKRESTVLGKLDASVMEQLVADFDEAEFNEDVDEPLPPNNSNVFGNRFN